MLLEMLKINLGIRSTAYDERLLQLLEASKSQIEQEGVQNLSEDNPLDAQLIVDYAEWLWRRRDTKEVSFSEPIALRLFRVYFIFRYHHDLGNLIERRSGAYRRRDAPGQIVRFDGLYVSDDE